MNYDNQNYSHGGPSRIGIDIGRVLLCPTAGDGRPDTSFLSGRERDALAIEPTELAFDTVLRLVEEYEGNVWLVSKAGPRIQALTLQWLEHHDFYRRTRVPRENVRFCRERRDKREHAALLRLTHFIDDRVDVLQHLRGLVPTLLLFGWQPAPAPTWVQQVADWSVVAHYLLGDGEELGRDVLGQPHAVASAEE